MENRYRVRAFAEGTEVWYRLLDSWTGKTLPGKHSTRNAARRAAAERNRANQVDSLIVSLKQ